jgi:hypothetical protein
MDAMLGVESKSIANKAEDGQEHVLVAGLEQGSQQ